LKSRFSIQFSIGLLLALVAALLFLLDKGTMWAIPILILGIGLISTARRHGRSN